MLTALHTQRLLQRTRDYLVYLSLSHPLPATTKATILLHMLLIREHIFSTSGYCRNQACSQEMTYAQEETYSQLYLEPATTELNTVDP